MLKLKGEGQQPTLWRRLVLKIKGEKTVELSLKRDGDSIELIAERGGETYTLLLIDSDGVMMIGGVPQDLGICTNKFGELLVHSEANLDDDDPDTEDYIP